MKEEPFEKYIRRLKEKPLPSCPGATEANVLRRVRLSRVGDENGFWAWMGSLRPGSALMAAALGLVVLTTSIVTVASVSTQASRMERKLEANRALDLAVFTKAELIDFNNPGNANERQ